jgi:hypothetical protein
MVISTSSTIPRSAQLSCIYAYTQPKPERKRTKFNSPTLSIQSTFINPIGVPPFNPFNKPISILLGLAELFSTRPIRHSSSHTSTSLSLLINVNDEHKNCKKSKGFGRGAWEEDRKGRSNVVQGEGGMGVPLVGVGDAVGFGVTAAEVDVEVEEPKSPLRATS